MSKKMQDLIFKWHNMLNYASITIQGVEYYNSYGNLMDKFLSEDSVNENALLELREYILKYTNNEIYLNKIDNYFIKKKLLAVDNL